LTGSLTETTLAPAVASLREGTTEFMCHPGYLGAELRQAATRLKESRVRELEALTSRRIRQVIEEQGITLAGYR
jgi:chitin disaccharide deacetylase